MNCCIFGSFDPLTNGHEYIINESAKIFSTVYVLVIKNNKFKKRHYNYDACLKGIQNTFKNNQAVKVIEFKGDVYNFITENNCDYVVRGLRNVKDYKFEEFVYLRKFKSHFVKYLYLKTPYKNISSSLVYKLEKQKKMEEIKKIVPNTIFRSIF